MRFDYAEMIWASFTFTCIVNSIRPSPEPLVYSHQCTRRRASEQMRPKLSGPKVHIQAFNSPFLPGINHIASVKLKHFQPLVLRKSVTFAPGLQRGRDQPPLRHMSEAEVI